MGPQDLSGPHETYQLIAADGRVIYVGMTRRFKARMATHRRQPVPAATSAA